MRLCSIDDLVPGEARAFSVAGRSLFAVNYWGQIYAYLNYCPHQGQELNLMPDQFLDSSGELIECAQHGAQFNIETGICINGPCQGAALLPVVVEQRGTELWLKTLGRFLGSVSTI